MNGPRGTMDVPELFTLVFSCISDEKTRAKAISIFKEHEKEVYTGFGSGDSHQSYVGGLADHTLLVSLFAMDMASKLPDILFVSCKLDDVIVASLFHDFDKIGKYDKPQNRLYGGPIEVYSMLVDNGLQSPGMRDGIIHAHGGWSDYKEEPYGLVSIVVHAADMMASRVIKDQAGTRKAIHAMVSRKAPMPA